MWSQNAIKEKVALQEFRQQAPELEELGKAAIDNESGGGRKAVKQIVFEGEPFTALDLLRRREQMLGPPPAPR